MQCARKSRDLTVQAMDETVCSLPESYVAAVIEGEASLQSLRPEVVRGLVREWAEFVRAAEGRPASDWSV